MKIKLLFALLATGLFVLTASALDVIYGTVNVPTGLAALTNTTLTATTGTPLTLRANQTLTIMPSFVAAGTGTSNVVFGFDVSADGTHYTTGGPLTVTIAATGTTAVIGHGQLTAAQLGGAKYLRYGSVSTTQTNGVTVSAIYYGFTY